MEAAIAHCLFIPPPQQTHFFKLILHIAGRFSPAARDFPNLVLVAKACRFIFFNPI
ncbi:MAG: hypothetical protein QNJ45_13135 [Ardenticatenaceae bacterium]|nr:hypothetical protein [Ardenticatenaceae bacterium]